MPQDAGAGGYHWQSKSHVIGWDEGKAAMAEEREVGFAALLDDLPADPDTPLRVVDLGAGDGKVAEVVLERFQRRARPWSIYTVTVTLRCRRWPDSRASNITDRPRLRRWPGTTRSARSRWELRLPGWSDVGWSSAFATRPMDDKS
jgi:hypothetical protein